jgi:hypothetical protein
MSSTSVLRHASTRRSLRYNRVLLHIDSMAESTFNNYFKRNHCTLSKFLSLHFPFTFSFSHYQRESTLNATNFVVTQVSLDEIIAPMITLSEESLVIYKMHNLLWIIYYLSILSDATLYLFSVEQVARVRGQHEVSAVSLYNARRNYRGLSAGISLFTATAACRTLYGIASSIDASNFVVLSLGLMYLPLSRNGCKLTQREWTARISVTVCMAVALIAWIVIDESYWYAPDEGEDAARNALGWRTFGLFVAERLALWTVGVADVNYPRYSSWHEIIRMLASLSGKLDMILNYLIVSGHYRPPLATDQPKDVVKRWQKILRSITLARLCTLLAGTGLAYAVTIDEGMKQGWVLFEYGNGKFVIMLLLLAEALVQDFTNEDYDARDVINIWEWFDELTGQRSPEISQQALTSEEQNI